MRYNSQSFSSEPKSAEVFTRPRILNHGQAPPTRVRRRSLRAAQRRSADACLSGAGSGERQVRRPGMSPVLSGDRPVTDTAAQCVWRRLSGTRAHITSRSPRSLWTVSLNATSLPVREQGLGSWGLSGRSQQPEE